MRFEQVQPTGRTRPLLLECTRATTDKSERRRFVTKAIGLPEVFEWSLVHEYLGCRLGRLFGLSTQRAEFVNISPAFVVATRDDLNHAGIHVKPGIAVGVEVAPNLLPFPASPKLSAEEAVEAARIYAFDLLTQNPDRRAANPNCGRADGRIVPYDFESAFSFRLAILRTDPWRVAHLPFAREHLFFRSLKELTVDWHSVLGPFTDVSTAAVTEVCGTLPSAWSYIGAEIQAHLEAVFTHWPIFVTEVEASLGAKP